MGSRDALYWKKTPTAQHLRTEYLVQGTVLLNATEVIIPHP
jgi:hypothetical protein